MILYNHQKDFLEQNPPMSLLAWGTGTGKSRTAIEWAKQNLKTVILICPKGLKENWKREFEKWDPEGTLGFKIMSKEEFRKFWDYIPKSDGVICDEAHYFSGTTSLMTKSLQKFFELHNIKFRLLLTATPFLSTPWNIFILGKMVGAQWIYINWKISYFNEINFGRRAVAVPKKGIEEQMRKHILEVGSTVRLEDCFDVPEQTFEVEYLELTKKQQKAIEDNREPNAITKFLKQHQIENGVRIGDEFRESEFYDTDKYDRIVELMEENGKVAVFCRYNIQIDALKTYLEEKLKDTPVFVLRGDTEDRQGTVDEANMSKKCAILINTSISEGYELKTFGVIVYTSLSFSYKDYKQSLGRFLRADALKKNLYIHLVSGEVDTAVYESMMKKQDFDIKIFSDEREKLSTNIQPLAQKSLGRRKRGV